MKIQSISFLGFDGISDRPVTLSPELPTVIIGSEASGKSRLLALMEATVGEFSGRPLSTSFLKGPRGKVTLQWSLTESERQFVASENDATTEMFIGDHPGRSAQVERDPVLVLARKHRYSAASFDLSASGSLTERFRDRLSDHLLGIEPSEQIARLIELMSELLPLKFSPPRRVGRLLEPNFELGGGSRTFETLPRTFRMLLSLASRMLETTQALILIDDAQFYPREALARIVEQLKTPANQLVLFSQEPLHSSWQEHGLS